MNQHMAEEAVTNLEEEEGDSSEDKETDDQNSANKLCESAEWRSQKR
jgi:hypothetical protein